MHDSEKRALTRGGFLRGLADERFPRRKGDKERREVEIANGPRGVRTNGRTGAGAGADARTTLSRKRFLALGGAGLAGATLLGTAVARPAHAATASSLGIVPDDRAAAINNRQKLVEGLRYSPSTMSVTFPPGKYYIDNSGAEPGRGLNADGLIVIDGFNGQLTMEKGATWDGDARFVFTDKSRRGLTFYSGDGARFYGLGATFEPFLPDRRVDGTCVEFSKTKNTLVQDADIYGSAGAGLLFWQCEYPKVVGATIRKTMADGLHFANCLLGEAHDVSTDGTGDDGLAFVNYTGEHANAAVPYPDNRGGYAKNVHVKNGGARGITVIGQSGVTLDGFVVDNTYSCGLLVEQDHHWKSRVPTDVVCINGTVKNSGRARPGQLVSSEADKSGVNVLGAGKVYLDSVTSERAVKYGFYVGDNDEVRYGKLTSVDAHNPGVSEDPGARGRAFGFVNNATVGAWTGDPGVEPQELHVVDNQPTATGFAVVTSGAQQSGNLGAIFDKVARRDVYVDNQSNLSTAGRVSPGLNQTGVGLAANVKATFAEAMDPATFTRSTFKLFRSTTQVSNVVVSYDPATRTATLNPYGGSTTYLARGAWYRAVIEGGPGGVRDAGGNPLAIAMAWSFKTRT